MVSLGRLRQGWLVVARKATRVWNTDSTWNTPGRQGILVVYSVDWVVMVMSFMHMYFENLQIIQYDDGYDSLSSLKSKYASRSALEVRLVDIP